MQRIRLAVLITFVIASMLVPSVVWGYTWFFNEYPRTTIMPSLWLMKLGNRLRERRSDSCWWTPGNY